MKGLACLLRIEDTWKRHHLSPAPVTVRAIANQHATEGTNNEIALFIPQIYSLYLFCVASFETQMLAE